MPKHDTAQPQQKTPAHRAEHVVQHQRTFAKLAQSVGPAGSLINHGLEQLKVIEDDYLDGTIAEAVGRNQVGGYLAATLATLALSTMSALEHVGVCPNCGPSYLDEAEEFVHEHTRLWTSYVEPLTGKPPVFAEDGKATVN